MQQTVAPIVNCKKGDSWLLYSQMMSVALSVWQQLRKTLLLAAALEHTHCDDKEKPSVWPSMDP